MHLPAHIGDYTDFYACQEHARNAVGIRTGLRILTSNWYSSIQYIFKEMHDRVRCSDNFWLSLKLWKGSHEPYYKDM